MKRLMVSSILGALAFAVCSPSAEAQFFGRWRRNYNYNNGYYAGYNGYYNNGYYNGYNGNGWNGYNNGYAPGYAVPSYRTGAYQQGVTATAPVAAAPTLAAPRATVATPGTVPGGGGYPFNGPNVLPGPAGQHGNLPVGAGENPQYGAAPGGVGAGFGAGMGPAGSKIDEGTGTIGRP